MYDLPEVRDATNKWWSGLARLLAREGIVDVPHMLERMDNCREAWTRPDLLLSQTCGYPLTHELQGKVTLVAAPCYAAEGCVGPDYCSAVIVNADLTAKKPDDLRGKRCAFSSPTSHSGYNALRALIAPLAGGKPFFGHVEATGSHLSSVSMIAAGRADIAAIDRVTHALLERHNPEALAGTRVLCLTPAAPSLPYITHAGADRDFVRRLLNGLLEANIDPDLADCRDALLIAGFRKPSLEDYGRIVQMEIEAIKAGYAKLA